MPVNKGPVACGVALEDGVGGREDAVGGLDVEVLAQAAKFSAVIAAVNAATHAAIPS